MNSRFAAPLCSVPDPRREASADPGGDARGRLGAPADGLRAHQNEPVVCKPEEALDCFLRTKMDVLVMGDVVVRRAR